MSDTTASDPLHDLRRELFGDVSEGIPPAFLSQLSHLVGDADAKLGIRQGDMRRTAFWLKGRVLGLLACTGTTDFDAVIQGSVIRLDDVTQIDIEVTTAPQLGRQWDAGPGVFGWILKIGGNTVLDASPSSVPYPDKRAEIEEFIDRILAVFTQMSPKARSSSRRPTT